MPPVPGLGVQLVTRVAGDIDLAVAAELLARVLRACLAFSSE